MALNLSAFSMKPIAFGECDVHQMECLLNHQYNYAVIESTMASHTSIDTSCVMNPNRLGPLTSCAPYGYIYHPPKIEFRCIPDGVVKQL